MKRFKKFTYPFVFSICFFVIFIILAIVLEIVLPSGDYTGLAYAGVALLIWICVVIPIYCIKYCKLIRQEKYKFLFGFYNPLIIALCHTVPFLISAIPTGDADIIVKIALALFGWIAIWTIVPLITVKPGNNGSNELQE